jgi:peptidoglycan hydrolase-like amidase
MQSASALTLMEKPPKMRVGLFSSDDWVEATVNGAYYIKSKGTIIKEVPKNQITKITYDRSSATYYIEQNGENFASDSFVRLVPKKKSRIITVTSYENRPTWDVTLNDNEFKGKLEIRYAEATDTTWVIEIVGLENYVKGVAEAGNDNDADYLKTLYTAARTYAYWHYSNPSRHADEYYTLNTTANDQVYRGYNFTERAPNIAQAVEDTRGMVVTYDDELAITPYFSNSDGRTRSWSEVWNGDYPYLVTKDDPGCAGMTLTGHGVGLSAYGARYFAEQGWGWKKILKYYYTGVKMQAIY